MWWLVTCVCDVLVQMILCHWSSLVELLERNGGWGHSQGSRLEGLSSCHTHQPWPWLSDVVNLLNSILLRRHRLRSTNLDCPPIKRGRHVATKPIQSAHAYFWTMISIKSSFRVVGWFNSWMRLSKTNWFCCKTLSGCGNC